AGGDDDALAGEDDRQKISERLPGSSASFHDEVALFRERSLDGLRHLELSLTEFVGRMCLSQSSPGREELMQRRKFRWSGSLGGLGSRRHSYRAKRTALEQSL